MNLRRVAKVVLAVVSLVPALLLTRGLIQARLGPNPAETIQLETGIWAFRFLILTLVVTPVRRLTGWNEAIQYRRMLGLLAFFYAALHVTSYLAFDVLFAWGLFVEDVVKRPFITAGMIAFTAMVPLAITSTRGWIRRLGRRWQVLHRLIYVSAVGAAVHYLWKGKVIYGTPVIYAGLVAALLAFRVVWMARKRRVRPQPAQS
jgi:methionine sulfoxide reductase heme-binding subunit